MIFENVRFLNESINEKIANYLFNKLERKDNKYIEKINNKKSKRISHKSESECIEFLKNIFSKHENKIKSIYDSLKKEKFDKSINKLKFLFDKNNIIYIDQFNMDKNHSDEFGFFYIQILKYDFDLPNNKDYLYAIEKDNSVADIGIFSIRLKDRLNEYLKNNNIGGIVIDYPSSTKNIDMRLIIPASSIINSEG